MLSFLPPLTGSLNTKLPDASSDTRTEKAFDGDVVFEVDTNGKDRKVHKLERLKP